MGKSTEVDEIDKLKKRLQRTKRQEKRQKILTSYDAGMLDEKEKMRYEQLLEKAQQPMSVIKKILIIGVSVYIPCWIIMFLSLPLVSEERAMSNFEFLLSPFIMLAAVWCLIGPTICFVLIIILLIKRRKPNYYLNIKNI